VGFGVTIAESLGIYRIDKSTYMDPKRRSLLKRLFWALAVRDAYCSALLGRPFRLNITQCDTEPLTLEDFDHEENCPKQDHGQCLSHGHYQIQVSKLSLIHLKKRDDGESAAFQAGSLLPSVSPSSTQITESAAQMISSTTFTIMAIHARHDAARCLFPVSLLQELSSIVA
jgi:hypothetical protein